VRVDNEREEGGSESFAVRARARVRVFVLRHILNRSRRRRRRRLAQVLSTRRLCDFGAGGPAACVRAATLCRPWARAATRCAEHADPGMVPRAAAVALARRLAAVGGGGGAPSSP
jgi:hypothetical protein